MKIVYFYQYFSTPKGAWSTRVYDFAKQWVSQGHEVTVVTSVYAKSDLKAYHFLDDQQIEGISLKVINIKIDNKQSVGRRVFTFFMYSIISCWYAMTLPMDIAIASSGPISVGIPGLIVKYVRNKKMAFEVRDIWPDAVIELGVMQNKWLIKFAYVFEKLCYYAADVIITLSPGMKDNIEKRFGYTKVISVTNAANLSLFATPVEAILPSCFQGKKVIIYTGNIGKTNNSDLLYDAAKILNKFGNKEIMVVLVGDGQQRIELSEKAKLEGVNNFVILDLMPKKDLVALIQHSYLSIIPLADVPILSTSSPNKLYESLAAGVAVVQTTQGWIKDFLIEHKCGYTVSANASDLAFLLCSLLERKNEVEVYAKNAATVAQRFFDKDYLATQMLNCLVKTVVA